MSTGQYAARDPADSQPGVVRHASVRQRLGDFAQRGLGVREFLVESVDDGHQGLQPRTLFLLLRLQAFRGLAQRRVTSFFQLSVIFHLLLLSDDVRKVLDKGERRKGTLKTRYSTEPASRTSVIS